MSSNIYRLRLATADDAPGISEVYRPYIENTAITFESEVPSVSEIAGRIRAVFERHVWLVCTLDGSIVGYAYTTAHRYRTAYQWSAEISVYIDMKHQRKGIARAFYNALIECMTWQGYHRVFAGMTEPNPGSRALHFSMGFAHIGVFRNIGFKFGEWHDVSWFQRDIPQSKVIPEGAPRSIFNLPENTLSALLLKAESSIKTN